jgi:hypothetical protein
MTDQTGEFELDSFTACDRLATARSIRASASAKLTATDRAIRAAAASKLSREARPDRTPYVAVTDKQYTPEEMAFLAGIETFKNRTGRKFPTWSEVLTVIKELGYKRTD